MQPCADTVCLPCKARWIKWHRIQTLGFDSWGMLDDTMHRRPIRSRPCIGLPHLLGRIRCPLSLFHIGRQAVGRGGIVCLKKRRHGIICKCQLIAAMNNDKAHCIIHFMTYQQHFAVACQAKFYCGHNWFYWWEIMNMEATSFFAKLINTLKIHTIKCS